jgi:Na+-translocating ferredoxin:NAD+ oxidoreductase RnfG subunit
MLKTIRKHGITLALFAAGSTGLTAAINQLTKSTIDEQAALQQKALFDQVLPGDRYNNNLSESCYLVNACILPARTTVPLQQFLKLRRQMGIPGRFNCWSVSILRVPCWVRG